MAIVGTEALPTTNFFKSDGAIADVRFALAWTPRSWIRLGVGGHAIMGDNRLRSTQLFDDSARFAAIIDTSTITYVGTAVSPGATLFIKNTVGLAASYRKGNTMTVKHGDTTLVQGERARPHVVQPRVHRHSRHDDRGADLEGDVDGDAWARNADAADQRRLGHERRRRRARSPIGRSARIQVRAGARWRTLPFGLADSEIREKSASFGLGTVFARGRIALDVTGIRAIREPVSNEGELRESAWTLSTGLTIRP